MQKAEEAMKEYVALLRAHATCGGEPWLVSPRTREDGLLPGYAELHEYYTCNDPAKLAPSYDAIRAEVKYFQMHGTLVPSSFRPEFCNGECKRVAALRRSVDSHWSPKRVFAPLANNGYRSWLPTNSFIDAPPGRALAKHTFEPALVTLDARGGYTDEGYPSFLELKT